MRLLNLFNVCQIQSLEKNLKKNFFQMNVNTNLYFFSSFKGKKMYYNVNKDI